MPPDDERLVHPEQNISVIGAGSVVLIHLCYYDSVLNVSLADSSLSTDAGRDVGVLDQKGVDVPCKGPNVSR